MSVARTTFIRMRFVAKTYIKKKSCHTKPNLWPTCLAMYPHSSKVLSWISVNIDLNMSPNQASISASPSSFAKPRNSVVTMANRYVVMNKMRQTQPREAIARTIERMRRMRPLMTRSNILKRKTRKMRTMRTSRVIFNNLMARNFPMSCVAPSSLRSTNSKSRSTPLPTTRTRSIKFQLLLGNLERSAARRSINSIRKTTKKHISKITIIDCPVFPDSVARKCVSKPMKNAFPMTMMPKNTWTGFRSTKYTGPSSSSSS
mmetsp:Transcript_127383/g.317983  ORF Transcript_127383/g.317983 Transcript_127383/m.317983 type:complete len:259 (-) Transcript_127383:185-961(-)